MTSDPIADLLTRIKNAVNAKHGQLNLPHSRLKEELVKVMVATGHLGGYTVTGAKPHLELQLKAPRLEEARRLSRPGMRLYAAVNDLPRLLKRRGVVILSTAKGLMTAKEASRQKVGGELLCHLI